MSKNNSKTNKNNSRTNGLLAVLILLVIVLIIMCLVYIGRQKKERNNVPKATATSTATFAIIETPTPTPGGEFYEPTPTGAPEITPIVTLPPDGTPTPSPTPTPTPTAAPTQPTEPTATPDPDNVYYTGMDPTAGSLMDYSFLANVSTDYFHDINIHDFYTSGKYKGKLMGSWWSGTEIKDSEGNVTDVKRSAATEALLKKYNACYVNREAGKTIYLTFDCGYENGVTGKILDVLKEKNVKGIFFVTSQFLAEPTAKELCERMIAEGHLIGNHTYSHPNMMLASNDEFVQELRKNEDRLEKLLGYRYEMSFYRPPEGASNERDLALAQKLGYRIAFWSYAYYDYNPDAQMEPSKALDKIEKSIHPGGVYLLHAVSETNAAILGDFIDYGQANGYTFSRIDNY